jgi:hypothetical protein
MVHKIRFPTGRPRDARSWRKAFKAEWKACYARETSAQDRFPYLRYEPDPSRWVCACPAFFRSRFLICKHLVKSCHPAPSQFFLEVQRNRTTPFWKHPSLIPLNQTTTSIAETPLPSETPSNDVLGPDEDDDGPDDDESDDGMDEKLHEETIQTLEQRIERNASILDRFLPLLRYQKQFASLQFSVEQDKQLARAVGWAEDCLEVEKLENSPSAEKQTTWGMKSTTMFLNPRPPNEIP